MPAADRAVLAAYARGVNYYLETHRGNLPLEFTLLNYDPRPWTHARFDSGGAAKCTGSSPPAGATKFRKLHMVQKGDRAKVDFLFPQRSGAEIQPGSNAWAISGAHTASGKPILANDPHLEFSLPSTWYMVHLRAPGLNVSGVALPGIPAVIIGHNERIAWGVTNLQFDVQDLYREQFDAQSGRYLFRGQMEQAHLERNAIAVKGEKPLQFDQWVTRHGPVFLNDQGQQYALRWSAAEPDGVRISFPRHRSRAELDGVCRRDRPLPRSGAEFRVRRRRRKHRLSRHRAVAYPASELWWRFAGRRSLGRVRMAGLHAVRAICRNSSIRRRGWLSPRIRIRFRRIISTQSAEILRRLYRSNGIRALLGAHEKWKPAEMLDVQKDVYSSFSYFLAKQMVAAFDASKNDNPQLREAVDLLRNWSGQMEKGTAAPLVEALLYQELKKAAADRAAPGQSDQYTFEMAPAAIERLLRERPPGWFPDYDKLLVQSLGQAIQAGEKLQGSKVSRWNYGSWNELTIANPVLGQLPLIGKYFNIGPVQMSGSGTTIKQTSRRLGPSMRMIVDLSDLDNSLENITIGESGQPLSWHYRDQWKAYYGATSFPMQFDKVDAKQVLTVNPGGE